MPDKDDFTFDEKDDLSKADLSSTIEGTEQQKEPETSHGKMSATAKDDARPRPLLLILLLVVVAGVGAYYFMGLGGTTPEVAEAPPTAKKTIALPPKPAQSTAPEPSQEKTEIADQADSQPTSPVMTDQNSAPVVEQTVSEQDSSQLAAKSEEAAKQEPKVAAETRPTAATVSPALPSAQPAQPGAPAEVDVTGRGSFTLDAGSFLLTGNRESLEKKIRALGYEPRASTIKATVKMYRLRLGSFTADQAKEALVYAKTIAPSSFILPEGDHFVVYGGTFINLKNAEKLREPFLKEGVQAELEPIEVIRTLSRIQFGDFDNEQQASLAAQSVADAGISATVVESK